MMPFLHHLLHGAPAGADGVEDDGLVAGRLQHLGRLHRALRGDADGGDGDERLVLAFQRHVDLGHAADRAGGIGQDLAASRDSAP